MKKINLIIGIILLLIGGFYALLPHTIHMSSGIGFSLAHTAHIIVGAVSLIIGIVVLLIGRDK